MECHEIVKNLLVDFVCYHSEENARRRYVNLQKENFLFSASTFSELLWLFLPPAPQHPLQPRREQSQLLHRNSPQKEPQLALSALDLQAGQQCFRIDSCSNFGIGNFSYSEKPMLPHNGLCDPICSEKRPRLSSLQILV